jgi:hypothetical protein
MEQVLYTKTPPGFTNLQMHSKNCQGNTRNKTFDQKEKSMSIVFKKKKKTESSIQDKQRNVLIKFSPKTDDVIVVIRERILISHGSRIKKLLLQFLKFFQILQPPIPSQVRSL